MTKQESARTINRSAHWWTKRPNHFSLGSVDAVFAKAAIAEMGAETGEKDSCTQLAIRTGR